MADFDPDEYPIAIQIFGRDPDEMAEAARVVEDLGASILDINIGTLILRHDSEDIIDIIGKGSANDNVSRSQGE